jgi:flagellar basal-body rod protein FlgB
MTPNAYGIGLLQQAMTAASLRHRVVANNLANVNTPGYRALEVRFEDELSKHLDRPEGVVPAVVESDLPERADGNTVDLDRELGAMNKNSLLYQAASQVLATRIAALRSAIAGR